MFLRVLKVLDEPLTDKIDDYSKDSGPGVVCPSCSFYHDPFRYQLFYLVRYKAHIHKLGSNSFSEPVHLISKPYDLK